MESKRIMGVQEIYHYYDDENIVHVGTFIKNRLKPNSYKASPMPFCEFDGSNREIIEDRSGRHFVKNGLGFCPLFDGIPQPVYNDDFGNQTYELKPNILESKKLDIYEKIFINFYSKGLSKEDIIKAIKLKNEIQLSRMAKLEKTQDREME